MAHRFSSLPISILKALSSLGLGFLPLPGVTATILGLSLFYFINFSPLEKILICLFLFTFGAIVATLTQNALSLSDPHFFILDEVFGGLVSVIFLPSTPTIFLAALIVFRLLDNLKPFPVSLGHRLQDGLGVMLDDLIAGLITFICLYYGQLLFR